MIFSKKNSSALYKRISFSDSQSQNQILSESCNIILKDGAIKARPGMSPAQNPAVFDPNSFGDSYAVFELSDLFVDLEEGRGQIAVMSEHDNYANVIYHISAVFSDGTKRSLSSITFSRTDSTSFPLPASYVIYNGKAVRGRGVFFLCRMVSFNNPDGYRVYELSEDADRWVLLMSSEFYTPTILKNGRGNQSSAALIYEDKRLDEPCLLEPMNMLNSAFYCYYTSDGYSYSFSLPHKSLANLPITCRLTINKEVVATWEINGGSDSSEYAEVNGTALRLRCNRNSGKVFFEGESGAPIAVPYYNEQNNLFFSAHSNTANPLKPCSMSRISRISKAFGTVTVFSSSSLYPGEFVWINNDNPLYFPETCQLKLDEPSGDIEAFFTLEDQVCAIKKNLFFSGKVGAAQPYDIERIVEGVASADTICLPSLSFNLLSALDCDVFGNTAKTISGKVFVTLKNFTVCSIDSSGKIASLGSAITGVAPDFAFALDGKYLLAYDNTCHVYDTDIYRYEWIFPCRIKAASEIFGKTVLFADAGDLAAYAFTLGEDTDTYLYGGIRHSAEIKGKAVIELMNEVQRCRLYELSLKTSGVGNISLNLLDGSKSISTERFKSGNIILSKPSVANRLVAKVELNGNVLLSCIGIKYTKLKSL